MINYEISETGQQFLIQLFEQTKGDSSVQVSMYDIGADLGLQRDVTAKVAEELIGSQLVEIRTLSGGIGISPDGLELVHALIGPAATVESDITILGNDPVLSSTGRQTVEQISAELKNQAGSLGMDYDTLTELLVDLKTIDAQLDSPRPKTAVVRECLRSVLGVLQNFASSKITNRIRTLVDG